MERLNGCCDVVMKFLAFSQGTQTLFARRKKEKDSLFSLSLSYHLISWKKPPTVPGILLLCYAPSCYPQLDPSARALDYGASGGEEINDILSGFSQFRPSHDVVSRWNMLCCTRRVKRATTSSSFLFNKNGTGFPSQVLYAV